MVTPAPLSLATPLLQTMVLAEIKPISNHIFESLQNWTALKSKQTNENYTLLSLFVIYFLSLAV